MRSLPYPKLALRRPQSSGEQPWIKRKWLGPADGDVLEVRMRWVEQEIRTVVAPLETQLKDYKGGLRVALRLSYPLPRVLPRR
jgi:hypothetical protein